MLVLAANLLDGFAAVLTPQNLLLAALGVTLGTLVGVLPGIGPALTIALLLPITFNFEDPVGAFILFAGIYAGGMYGGSTTSILLNTPGESASVATAIEGFEMARRGRGRAALATAAIGSFVAGTIGIVALTLVADPVASLAVKFRAEDYFALTLLAFASVTALTSSSLVRGFASLCVGLLIGFVGIDQLTGQSRLTFSVDQLGNGVDIVIVAVGLFAVGEALHMAAKLRSRPDELVPTEPGGSWLSKQDLRRSWKPWVRGAGIGFPFGALPAGGAEVPTFLSYATEKKLAPDREWGEGAIEGVAGPEAANNASFSGTLVPLLTLGIPTSATAAIMLAAFQIFNLQPGPELFETNSELVWTLIASLYVGNIMLLALNLPLIRVWVKVLEIPRALLYAGILVFGTLGVYSLSGSVVEVLVMYAIGVMGFFMRRFDFPIAPVILGVILGPLMETQARRALTASGDDFSVFFSRPLTVILLILAVAAFVIPHLPALKKRLAFGEDD
ncbi:tripartite tricarboxylate transporter permease [Solirubrobacter sp. CPCC 204708]|uniref:Tripartite tricarboxylate transporter permease n=1 Tax=Solirubrobacter deserti TaxID=2282478 RepID=A0ABT4RLZ2_9ACTN|nr:tripartite tricarboxylate transporter permease [Solirubrobacter deserti]MBE2314432.1 tripartite tricarboxylate transporter permease [Solirubrobacter deserti]MDA0139578.1 tripartite tricarboxylate transporter permease [Solirubrobacter deserti]